MFDECNGQRHFLAGPAGRLEVLCEAPEDPVAPPCVVIVCHPHTLHGGTLDNKVVYSVARAARHSGAWSVRFNFRGAGASEGEYDDGRGEREDLSAVVSWVRAALPAARIALAGFSFGSYVAYRHALEADACCLLTIAPPVNLYPFERLPAPRVPWLLIQGDQDEIVPPAAVLDWAHRQDDVQLRVLAGSGHFFHGRLGEIQDLAIDFLGHHCRSAAGR